MLGWCKPFGAGFFFHLPYLFQLEKAASTIVTVNKVRQREKAMTPKELLAKLAEQNEQIKALNTLWAELYPEFQPPSVRQFKVWLNMPYDFETVVYGLEKAMQQLNKRGIAVEQRADGALPMTVEDVIQYASGCMKKKKAGLCETA
jgi:hypothetical protein